MPKLSLVVVAVFAASILLQWYENHVKVLSRALRPSIVRTPNRYATFLVIRVIFTYGAIIGIWLSLNIYWALAALVFKSIVNRLTFKHLFNKQVWAVVPSYKEMLEEEMTSADSELKKRVVVMKAMAMARTHVKESMNS